MTSLKYTPDAATDVNAFNSLLSAWNHHQDLRFHGGSVADLVSSRIELDRRRQALR